MKKAVKRLGIALLVLLLAAAVAALIGRRLFRGTPAYFRSYTWDAQQRSVVNQRAADKLLRTRQLAQQAHFGEAREQRSGSPATQLAQRRQSWSLSFSEEELNAFFFHNSETFKEWKQKYEQYVTDPGIYLENGRLILAARANEIGSVISFHFAPSLTGDGKLHLRPMGAYGGRLPLPQLLINPYVERLRASMAWRIPLWHREAALDRNGGFNSSAVAVAMIKLLLNTFNDTPSEPVIFMPVDEGQTSVPLRITSVAIENRTLSLTVEPFQRSEREALFSRVQKP